MVRNGFLSLTRNRSSSAPEPSGYFDEKGISIDKSDIYRLAYFAGRLWRPHPLDAAGVLIRANNPKDMLPGNDHTNGWYGLFTRGLEIVQTTGNHYSMITDEHAAALAQQLNSVLDRYEPAANKARGRFTNDSNQGVIAGQGRFGQTPRPQRTVA